VIVYAILNQGEVRLENEAQVLYNDVRLSIAERAILIQAILSAEHRGKLAIDDDDDDDDERGTGQ